MKELVLGGGRAVSVSLLVDSSGICSSLCSFMSLSSLTHLCDEGNDSYPLSSGKRDEPDCGKEKSSQSK